MKFSELHPGQRYLFHYAHVCVDLISKVDTLPEIIEDSNIVLPEYVLLHIDGYM